jgi:hypothetical protein
MTKRRSLAFELPFYHVHPPLRLYHRAPHVPSLALLVPQPLSSTTCYLCDSFLGCDLGARECVMRTPRRLWPGGVCGRRRWDRWICFWHGRGNSPCRTPHTCRWLRVPSGIHLAPALFDPVRTPRNKIVLSHGELRGSRGAGTRAYKSVHRTVRFRSERPVRLSKFEPDVVVNGIPMYVSLFISTALAKIYLIQPAPAQSKTAPNPCTTFSPPASEANH